MFDQLVAMVDDLVANFSSMENISSPYFEQNVNSLEDLAQVPLVFKVRSQLVLTVYVTVLASAAWRSSHQRDSKVTEDHCQACSPG